MSVGCPSEEGRRKKEEKSLNFFQLSIPDSQLPVTDYEEGRTKKQGKGFNG
jgi:hypothetical protein